jgi:thiopeptide-type bacteriocin biosynthesis protein
MASSARDLLSDGSASNFFFMHKPPGIRLRYEAGSETQPELVALLHELAAGWSVEGLISSTQPGVYEPEEQIFGGSYSMPNVHELFTVDSLAWLDHHSDPSPGWPSWMFSLYTLRALLDGLQIIGWEDLGMWNQMRLRAARDLPPAVVRSAECVAAIEGIRSVWSSIGTQKPPNQVHLRVERDQAATAAAAQRWREQYFDTSAATMGPRSAAAMAVIFHWNRGALPSFRQALLTVALADRSVL